MDTLSRGNEKFDDVKRTSQANIKSWNVAERFWKVNYVYPELLEMKTALRSFQKIFFNGRYRKDLWLVRLLLLMTAAKRTAAKNWCHIVSECTLGTHEAMQTNNTRLDVCCFSINFSSLRNGCIIGLSSFVRFRKPLLIYELGLHFTFMSYTLFTTLNVICLHYYFFVSSYSNIYSGNYAFG